MVSNKTNQILTLAMVAAIVLACAGCSREQVSSAISLPGKAYNESYKSNVVKNWEARVKDTPECRSFKERFRMIGDRYDNAANGAFAMDVAKVWEEAKVANCG